MNNHLIMGTVSLLLRDQLAIWSLMATFPLQDYYGSHHVKRSLKGLSHWTGVAMHILLLVCHQLCRKSQSLGMIILTDNHDSGFH